MIFFRIFFSKFTDSSTTNKIDVSCSDTQFKCQLGGCVDQSKTCNGFSDCTAIDAADTSDEAGCGM